MRPGAISWSGAYRAFAAQMIVMPPHRRVKAAQFKRDELGESVSTYMRPWATTGAT